MPFDTFTPPRRPDAGGTDFMERPRLIKAQFGDAYTQTAPDGLNPVRIEARLTWSNLDVAEATQILSFVRARVGTPFYYTIPGEGLARQWRAVQWSRDFSQGVLGTVTLDLEESFDPDI